MFDFIEPGITSFPSLELVWIDAEEKELETIFWSVSWIAGGGWRRLADLMSILSPVLIYSLLWISCFENGGVIYGLSIEEDIWDSDWSC